MGILRWVRRRHWCCKCCMFILVVIVTLVSIGGYHVYHQSTCSEEDSRKLVNDLCHLYRKHEVDGSMCRALCEDNTLRYTKCTNYRHGKKVFFMTCDTCQEGRKNVQVVFKMKKNLEDSELRLEYRPVNLAGQTKDDYIGMIQTMVTNTFEYQFGLNFTTNKDILSYVWGWDFYKYLEDHKDMRNVTNTAVDSVWSLSQQLEYMLSIVLQDRTFIPKVYGTCGPAYIVEYTETLGKWEFEFFSGSSHSWKKRAALALKLIDLIRQLDTDLTKPLHLCDVKPDNFGLRNNGEVTLIDTDCATFEDKLEEQFFHSNCSNHDDCDFFDCKGFCDISTNKCHTKRTNNNMQSLCEDVFIGYFSKFPSGLLRDPPLKIKVELLSVLNDCAYPGQSGTKGNVREPTSQQTIARLEKLLLNNLDTH